VTVILRLIFKVITGTFSLKTTSIRSQEPFTRFIYGVFNVEFWEILKQMALFIILGLSVNIKFIIMYLVNPNWMPRSLVDVIFLTIDDNFLLDVQWH